MMDYERSVNRMLHDEHLATIALLERCESTMAAYRKSVPSVDDPEVKRLLADLKNAVDSEIGTHFGFEQDRLFPMLGTMGDNGMVMILTDEHDTILPLGQAVTEVIGKATTGGFDADSWGAFRKLVEELVERMISHIQKEEMGLLPALEDLLDSETDMTLAEDYAQLR